MVCRTSYLVFLFLFCFARLSFISLCIHGHEKIFHSLPFFCRGMLLDLGDAHDLFDLRRFGAGS